MTRSIRRLVAAGTVMALVSTVAITACALNVTPPGTRHGSLVSFGPIHDQNGFPTSYKDSRGVRLEGCFNRLVDDPFCGADPPDPSAPVSFPGNFPDEFFYQLATSVTDAPPAFGGGRVLVEMNLEGAFGVGPAAPGDQIVFGRLRFRAKDLLDGTYRITHPYGVDQFVATGGTGINSTEDIGVTPQFTGALNSRIGPFLRWDPAIDPPAPAGHTGDPGVLHEVIGSPFDTNFVRVERLDGTTWTTVLESDLFSVQGRYAVNSGVDVERAVFTTASDGTGFLDVFATSDTGKSIQISANPALGTPVIPMREQNGRYFAHIALSAPVPPGATIEVVNTSDSPVAKKTVAPTDLVTITSATYDADAQVLSVTATSSDGEPGANAPVLTVDGADFGPLVSGSATFTGILAPPASVVVTSSRGGRDSQTPTVTGTGFATPLPVAAFTMPATASVGETVHLDASSSTGGITTYAWQVSGPGTPPVLTGPNTSFVPQGQGTYTVTLTVSGPGGTSAPVSHDVVVGPAVTVTANAGPDQTVRRGTPVGLTSAGTAGAATLQWEQVSGTPVVTLNGATTASPTFVYPLMPLPSGPAGTTNPGYQVANQPLTFRLTATASNGVTTSTDTVTVTPQAEAFTALTARFRTGRSEWRVTGTTSIRAGQTVAVVLGSQPTGAFIGQATVDAAGAFSFRGTGAPVPSGQTQVRFVSATGGSAVGALLVTG